LPWAGLDWWGRCVSADRFNLSQSKSARHGGRFFFRTGRRRDIVACPFRSYDSDLTKAKKLWRIRLKRKSWQTSRCARDHFFSRNHLGVLTIQGSHERRRNNMNPLSFKVASICQARNYRNLPKADPKNNESCFRTSRMGIPIGHSWQRKIALIASAVALAASAWFAPDCLAAEVDLQTNLVSDLPGVVPAERQLINISTRASVGTGDNVAIAGFIVHSDPPVGTGSKRVLLRGIGPSLKVNGVPVPGRLADPFLELHDVNGTLIESNDNWMNSPEKDDIIASGLAPTDPHESAILRILTAGTNYTAVLHGVNNTTGIGLVEVYDLEPTNDTHLANISGRAFVSTEDDVLIGGVIIRGNAAEQVLFRAIGPSLASKGVTNPLMDPTLDLHDENGTLIAHNDDWMNSPQRNSIIVTGLAPTDPRESAILEVPAAGNYTAIVRGKNNTTGIALVEAYRLGPPPPPPPTP